MYSRWLLAAGIMATDFVTEIATGTYGQAVGRSAAEEAHARMDRDEVDFCQVFASPKYDSQSVVDGIREVVGEETRLLGCTSAGEFSEGGLAEESVALALVSSDTHQFFTSMGHGQGADAKACVSEAVADLPEQVEGYPYNSVINLHDGLVGNGEQLALETQRAFGQRVGIAGGGAGDDLKMESTEVFCDGEVASDAVALAMIASEEPVAITVDHGHEPISDPIEVTDSDEEGYVYELDGKPAFEVWKDEVREVAAGEEDIDVDAVEPGDDKFTELLNKYPFGIDQVTEYKIRWPGLTDTTDGPMWFGVDIPEGTVFKVMRSPEEKQVESVVRAVNDAKATIQDRDIAGGFLYDCVCRSAILGDGFADSVHSVADELGRPLLGFETYGEMCMQQAQLGGYHNATSVVMLLPD